jgi:hypothetical protein
LMTSKLDVILSYGLYGIMPMERSHPLMSYLRLVVSEKFQWKLFTQEGTTDIKRCHYPKEVEVYTGSVD